MTIVNKQRKVKYRQQMNTDSKFMHMNNINVTFFFLSSFFFSLSEKHGLLGLCIKYIRLMKDV